MTFNWISQPMQERPVVLLTFAQSLNGIIGRPGGQLILSGSRVWNAHAFRQVFDGILIGIGTVLNDDPSLTTRLVPDLIKKHPRPIVVDYSLTNADYRKFIGRSPIVLTCVEADPGRVKELESLGCTLRSRSLMKRDSKRLDLAVGIKELKSMA